MNKKHPPLVSVIIPVYKVERFLKRCLDSVLNQTLTDFEVICVNDGSPDKCDVILGEYAARDKRIHVITQENQGLSVARNNGLKAACGKYVYFCDSDDYIHPQLLEITCSLAERHQAEMVSFGLQRVGEAERIEPQDISLSSIQYKVTDEPLWFFKKRCRWKIHVNTWSKLYLRQFIQDTLFRPGIYFEDYPHTAITLLHHPKTVIIREALYYYTYNQESISNMALTPKHIRDYGIGLSLIEAVYRQGNPKEYRFIIRELFSNILKQQLNAISKSEADRQECLWRVFAEELRDLDAKGCIQLRGNKLKRYFIYKKLIEKERTMAAIQVAFCVNDGYINQLGTVLISLLKSNPKQRFEAYILSSDLSDQSRRRLSKIKMVFPNIDLRFISVDETAFKGLNLTINYISKETFYRYLIPNLIPDVDKILYLDADLIVKGDLSALWETDLGDCYLAGCSDTYIEKLGYKNKIGLKADELYINAGVLLMNAKEMRRQGVGEALIKETKALSGRITYQDQDVLNLVCRNKIKQVDGIYNFTMEDIKSAKEKIKRAVVIHYTGAKKPWNTDKVRLKSVWRKYAKAADTILSRKIKVGLLIDEFFGGAGTAFGGYGFLARQYVARYIPDEDIQMDVLLGRGKRPLCATKYHEDNIDLYKLPKFHFASRWWLKRRKYDIYLSIELTTDWVLKHETNPNVKLILWIQDPRPRSAWDNVIDTMRSIKDPCFFSPGVYRTVHEWAMAGRVRFISQGYSLNPLALELYNLPENTPIRYLPNPIDLDQDYQLDLSQKKKQVIFLGRLEAQKRCWLFCEVAKRMPEYEFYVLGQFFRYQEDNKRMLAPYMNGDIPNLHFIGHVDGEQKKKMIRESRILLSTAIWEGIPISWLEALSYGTVLVSDLEREELAARFGMYIGTVPGDGFEGVDKFIPAIRSLMEDDRLYLEKARSAIEYIRKTHGITCFQNNMKKVIWEVME